MLFTDVPLTIFSFLIIYIFILYFLRAIGFKSRIYSKTCNNCCPNCDGSLERIRRNYYDHFTNYFTFYIFNFKKFNCQNCDWIGLKSECQRLKKSK